MISLDVGISDVLEAELYFCSSEPYCSVDGREGRQPEVDNRGGVRRGAGVCIGRHGEGGQQKARFRRPGSPVVAGWH